MKAVAIDGPAGAGKSVDTGALYRAIGFYVRSKGVDVTDETAIMGLLVGTSIELRFVDTEQRVFLNGQDITGKIRTEAVSMAASSVSALPSVRSFLLELQRGIARENNVVMDGRDIGTVVLPEADVKIFLTASPEERAKRRYEELINKGVSADYDAVLADLVKRDYDDSHREIAPLKPADSAIMVDTTGNTLEKSVELITKIAKDNL